MTTAVHLTNIGIRPMQKDMTVGIDKAVVLSRRRDLTNMILQETIMRPISIP